MTHNIERTMIGRILTSVLVLLNTFAAVPLAASIPGVKKPEEYYQQILSWKEKLPDVPCVSGDPSAGTYKPLGSITMRILCPRNAFTTDVTVPDPSKSFPKTIFGMLPLLQKAIIPATPSAAGRFVLSIEGSGSPYVNSDGTVKGTRGKSETDGVTARLYCVDMLPARSEAPDTIVLMDLPHTINDSIFARRYLKAPVMVVLRKIMSIKASLAAHEYHGAKINYEYGPAGTRLFDQSNNADYYVTMNIIAPAYRWNPVWIAGVSATAVGTVIAALYLCRRR